MVRPLPHSIAVLVLLLLMASGQASAEPANEPWPTRYGGPDVAPEVTPFERRVLDVLAGAMADHGSPPCRPTLRLTAAARAHARELVTAATARRIEPSVVRREIIRRGSVDPMVVPWALAARGELDVEGRRERLAERFGRRPPTHCGVGVVERGGRTVAVLVGVQRYVDLEPFPSRLARGDRVRLEGRLALEYRSPSVMVTTPLGEVMSHQTLRRAGRFGAWLDFPLPGRYTIEVMAVGRQGPQIVALFPVFVDAPPSVMSPSEPSPSVAQDRHPDSPAVSLFRRLNHERRRIGVDPLEFDDQLTSLATAHSRDMVERRYFGHVSPTGTDLTARLDHAGLATLHAAENLVRGGSAARAHAQLMESPAHRANLLDPDLTHVGIGVIEREGELVVTQIFVSW